MEDQNPRVDDTEDHSSMIGNVHRASGAIYCDVCSIWLCDSRQWAEHCEGKKHRTNCKRQNAVRIYSSSGAPAPQRSELRHSEARSSNVNPGSCTHSEAAATMCDDSEHDMDVVGSNVALDDALNETTEDRGAERVEEERDVMITDGPTPRCEVLGWSQIQQPYMTVHASLDMLD